MALIRLDWSLRRPAAQLLLASAIVLASSSCGPDSSETLCDPDVSGITMTARVGGNAAGGITTYARLEYADSPCAGDSMTINGVEATVHEKPTSRSFQLHFDFEADDGYYEFAFHRPGRDEPVIAHVTLPVDLVLTSPSLYTEVSLVDGFEVAWAPAQPGDIEIDFEDATPNVHPDGLPCLQHADEIVPDSGAYTVPGGLVAFEDEWWERDICELRVSLRRTEEGVYPPEFAPGTITASRSVSVIVKPLDE